MVFSITYQMRFVRCQFTHNCVRDDGIWDGRTEVYNDGVDGKWIRPVVSLVLSGESE